jgi:hypothetical protein
MDDYSEIVKASYRLDKAGQAAERIINMREMRFYFRYGQCSRKLWINI